MYTSKMINALVLSIGIVFSLGVTACDRSRVETVKTTEGPNGTKVEKKTVTEHNDGTVTEEKETRTVNP